MLILNIQFWENDKAQAMALARLMADLEPVPRTDVYMLFTARFDCSFDEETIDYCSKKFKVARFKCKRTATGWPNGPNQMMGESYEHCVEAARKGKYPGALAVFMIEADCVPLHPNWINLIIKEYTDCRKMVLGCWLTKDDCGLEHINGNCIISLGFWKKCHGIFHPATRGGWDATLRGQIMPNGAASRLIWSDYQLGYPHNPWRGCEHLWSPKRYRGTNHVFYGQDILPIYFHGIKTMDGIACVREQYLNERKD